MSDFKDLALDPNILKILGEIGYETPTSIQEMAIPKVLQGMDVIASAQTGTGKTGAFMLPALHQLSKLDKPNGKGPQMLVLAPTRELAMQIASEAERYSKYLPHMRTVCVYGGVPYPVQRRAMSRPYNILVATPGRLLDHMERGSINLSQLKILVLDEADRMLDMGFIDAVERIAAAAPKNRQTLLFSATLDSKIFRFSQKLQKNPHEIRVKQDEVTKDNIEQRLFYADNFSHKMRLLEHMLENTKIDQAIVFTSTKRAASEIARQLQDKGHLSDELHGDMNQRQRTRTIEKLRSRKIHILVATDVAARGIDILTLSHVFNIDLPFTSEDYIHRIGRTGRAGGKGCAITFATYQEKGKISKINHLMGKPIELHTIAGLEPQARQERHDAAPRNNFRKPFGKHQRRPHFSKGKVAKRF